MSIEKVKAYFASVGLADRIHEFEVSSATVALAAEALHCESARIAKTLAFARDDGALLIVAAGDAKVDNPKFKARFGMKARMLSPEDTLRLVGHAVGGVCPFLINPGVSVYLDESLRRFDEVYPAAGNSQSGIRLTIAELEEHARADGWVDVCKAWQAE